ncbi:OLC1v1007025C3 [Oldenlandia corymbosa var. corymbosa]|uniref:OLC1v1007025C3 n=2 Tax=Oldenlandia corymbosa var. corymbosa TaxID=529605 RepID=A0AAV1DL48_OLDCO|nr:OLC1v1007025C3 [Oldenlandia corymbosa var. corymbosa]
MVALTTLARYIASRMEYSVNLSFKNFQQGVKDVDVWKNFFQGKLTYVHWTKGEEMAPTIGPQGGTLLVRRLISPDSSRVDVGDVVVLKDPENSDNLIVRRLAAVEGYEMVSKDEKDEPFVLDDDECWVVADNENMKPKQEAYDSRTFGPVSMSNIVGRVLYCLRNAVDHGPVNNSETSMRKDSAILEVELDVDEMVKNHKA